MRDERVVGPPQHHNRNGVRPSKELSGFRMWQIVKCSSGTASNCVRGRCVTRIGHLTSCSCARQTITGIRLDSSSTTIFGNRFERVLATVCVCDIAQVS